MTREPTEQEKALARAFFGDDARVRISYEEPANDQRPGVRPKLAVLFSVLAFIWLCLASVALLWLVGTQT